LMFYGLCEYVVKYEQVFNGGFMDPVGLFNYNLYFAFNLVVEVPVSSI